MKFVEWLFVSRLVVGQKDQAAFHSETKALTSPLGSLKVPQADILLALQSDRRVWRQRGAVVAAG